jgi:hypothetical protein
MYEVMTYTFSTDQEAVTTTVLLGDEEPEKPRNWWLGAPWRNGD